ncbi:cysteine-rich receptor-like protein kinase 10 isoform X2 [Syzygium oleosum]|uniref:cysteine-rich receptor-like protein kinase 10 isoform X2 n=1 Tax=Syzygium oleosum TaxID=219896 RepID=UPI0024BA9216|nr:cysteine-rich receptor-like protein kinase 10 isoform X2 [Syzygium oleosum]
MNFGFIIFLALFFFLNFLSNYSHTTEAVPTYIQHDCPDTTLFAPNSTYQSNLNALLSALSSAATDDADGFANATAGKDPSDRAYGLFLCRGDVGTATCRECVATGTEDILRRCPDRRSSVIWYDECMLRYSDESVYSVMETVPIYMMPDAGDIAEPDRFVKLLGEAMNDVAGRASGSESGKKFAVVEASFTSSQKLYALAQCTSDLKGSDCNTCLRAVIASLPQGKQGGGSFTPTCGVRFELYPFYNASAVAAVPLLPSPPAAPVNEPKGKSNKSNVVIIAVAVPVGIGVSLLFLACRFSRRKATKTNEAIQGDQSSVNGITKAEFLQYDLATIQAATDNFSHQNKLGEGGFGEVFQGRLPNGQEIAVKRLSKSSGQGVGEFKNEVVLVSKLQHRNLVRLLGFCLDGEEKLLVYEFVPNKSLDYFLVEPDKRRKLDWSRCYKIISGIARGMLYLHEDSRLRIIHRDLKPSNILLDIDMNPKISDFGMATIFEVDQTRANTKKIVGTFGCLSPEYAMRGQISMKSDVYSFGVLILEIISDKKNSCFNQSDGGVEALESRYIAQSVRSVHWRLVFNG